MSPRIFNAIVLAVMVGLVVSLLLVTAEAEDRIAAFRARCTAAGGEVFLRSEGPPACARVIPEVKP